MRKLALFVLAFAWAVASGAASVRADGYLTARGLYDDCSAGATAGFDLERQEQRRKCDNFLASVESDWLRASEREPWPESKHVPCRAGFLSYWDGRGFGVLGGFTMSAREAVLEFLDASEIGCVKNRFEKYLD